MSSNRRFKSSLELSTSASGSPLIARPDAVVGNSIQTSIGHSQKHLLKKFAPPFERYQLVQDKEIKSSLRVRSRSFVTKTVDKRLLPDYEGTDWVVDKKHKKSVVLKKPKPHYAMFEDRVWTILARMGFTTLSKPDIKLPYTDDESIPGKQIDIFAADSETLIVVECKSSETMKKDFFSKELQHD